VTFDSGIIVSEVINSSEHLFHTGSKNISNQSLEFVFKRTPQSHPTDVDSAPLQVVIALLAQIPPLDAYCANSWSIMNCIMANLFD